jgi:hypothetical protein
MVVIRMPSGAEVRIPDADYLLMGEDDLPDTAEIVAYAPDACAVRTYMARGADWMTDEEPARAPGGG